MIRSKLINEFNVKISTIPKPVKTLKEMANFTIHVSSGKRVK